MHKLLRCSPVYLFLLVLMACSPDGEQTVTPDPNGGALQVSPEQISRGEIVTLSFPQDHPSGLAIRDPRGDWFYLQNVDDSNLLLSETEFRAADRLLLDTGSLVGAVWRDGKKVEELVFTLGGEYMVYMAENLETEPENTFHFMAKVKLVVD